MVQFLFQITFIRGFGGATFQEQIKIVLKECFSDEYLIQITYAGMAKAGTDKIRAPIKNSEIEMAIISKFISFSLFCTILLFSLSVSN